MIALELLAWASTYLFGAVVLFTVFSRRTYENPRYGELGERDRAKLRRMNLLFAAGWPVATVVALVALLFNMADEIAKPKDLREAKDLARADWRRRRQAEEIRRLEITEAAHQAGMRIEKGRTDRMPAWMCPCQGGYLGTHWRPEDLERVAVHLQNRHPEEWEAYGPQGE